MYNLQGNFNPVRFAGGVVAFHTAFALLEKRRIENFEEKGEVSLQLHAQSQMLPIPNDHMRHLRYQPFLMAELAAGDSSQSMDAMIISSAMTMTVHA